MTRYNTLAAYVALGGKVWLAGGGGAYACQIPWDDPSNNVPTTTFSDISPRRELVPGRFMYDFPAWRSEIRVTRVLASISRFTGRFPPPVTLPANLQPKTPATDPLPPQRTNPSEFYINALDIEFLQRENYIVESVNEGEESTLDSLYRATGSGVPPPSQNPYNVVMTYYHGPNGAPFVFSGFNFWSFQRAQCQGLVDYVLQDLWGLSRSPAPQTAAFRTTSRQRSRK